MMNRSCMMIPLVAALALVACAPQQGTAPAAEETLAAEAIETPPEPPKVAPNDALTGKNRMSAPKVKPAMVESFAALMMLDRSRIAKNAAITKS